MTEVKTLPGAQHKLRLLSKASRSPESRLTGPSYPAEIPLAHICPQRRQEEFSQRLRKHHARVNTTRTTSSHGTSEGSPAAAKRAARRTRKEAAGGETASRRNALRRRRDVLPRSSIRFTRSALLSRFLRAARRSRSAMLTGPITQAM